MSGIDIGGAYDADAGTWNDREDLPHDIYVARIVDAKREAISKKRDCGDCLVLTWKVAEGEFADRLFWQRVNLWYDDPDKDAAKTRELASRMMNSIGEATGVRVIRNTDEILEIPCLVTWGPQRNEPKYSEVKDVKPLDRRGSAAAASTSSRGSGGSGGAATSPPKNPWGKKPSDVFQKAAGQR
jgi:hypothetical protein